MTTKNHDRRSIFIVAFSTCIMLAILSSFASAAPPMGRFAVNQGIVSDGTTGIEWQQDVDATTRNHAAATSYCAGLSLNGGGWRLPTTAELQSIVDEQRVNPSIDPIAFPSTPAEPFWTSTPVHGFPGNAWLVSFDVGYSSTQGGGATYRARCAR